MKVLVATAVLTSLVSAADAAISQAAPPYILTAASGDHSLRSKAIHANNNNFYFKKPTTTKCPKDRRRFNQCGPDPDKPRTQFLKIVDDELRLNSETGQLVYINDNGAMKFGTVDKPVPKNLTNPVDGFVDSGLAILEYQLGETTYTSHACDSGDGSFQIFWNVVPLNPKKCQQTSLSFTPDYAAFKYT